MHAEVLLSSFKNEILKNHSCTECVHMGIVRCFSVPGNNV